MSTFLIPLVNVPQSFVIALAGVNYLMVCKWNDSLDAGWVFDLTNSDTNEAVLNNAPLITGADCLAGLEYLGIQGQMIVLTSGDPTAVPTLDNLGVDCNLYFITSVPNG